MTLIISKKIALLSCVPALYVWIFTILSLELEGDFADASKLSARRGRGPSSTSKRLRNGVVGALAALGGVDGASAASSAGAAAANRNSAGKDMSKSLPVLGGVAHRQSSKPLLGGQQDPASSVKIKKPSSTESDVARSNVDVDDRDMKRWERVARALGNSGVAGLSSAATRLALGDRAVID